ncbi:MAG: Cyclin-L1 [Paramarteilia canceri]
MVECRLTLETQFVESTALRETPTQQAGLDQSHERALRFYACQLTQASAKLLSLPQEVSATAQILFQLYYYQKSMLEDDFYISSIACLYIATKVEDELRKLRDIINVYHYFAKKFSTKNYKLLDLVKYQELKKNVIKLEFKILAALGYNVRINNPHKIIFIYLRLLNLHENLCLVQSSWNYMNDALRSQTIFACHRPELVACACICLAARNQNIPLPTNPHWFLAFNASETSIMDIVNSLIEIYRNKISYENVKQAKRMMNIILDSKKTKKVSEDQRKLPKWGKDEKINEKNRKKSISRNHSNDKDYSHQKNSKSSYNSHNNFRRHDDENYSKKSSRSSYNYRNGKNDKYKHSRDQEYSYKSSNHKNDYRKYDEASMKKKIKTSSKDKYDIIIGD